MTISIRNFEISDYPAAYDLWRRTEGIGLSAADERDNVASFLARNPGHSFVALDGEKLVAAILCGHDGRRGLAYHLATAETHRRLGIGRQLVSRAIGALRDAGIDKCHLLVFKSNEDGIRLWRSVGAEERVTLSLFSIETAS